MGFAGQVQGLLPGCKEARRKADRKAGDYEAARSRAMVRPNTGSSRLFRSHDTPEKMREDMTQAQASDTAM